LAGALFLSILLLCLFGYARLFWADHGQCGRVCARAFGADAAGARSFIHPGLCSCAKKGVEIGRILRKNPDTGPKDPGELVCGSDGVSYANEQLARLHTLPLHIGRCGACSNLADLAVYRRTASELTDIATACAFRNTLFGEGAGRACMAERSGLSAACIDCWVENMSCTAAHCLSLCLLSRLHGEAKNLPNGDLNPCLACDEAYCGEPFIRCAGANRRRAGILSDISRPAKQLWRGLGRP
jgi:hypothetical protein